MYTYAMDVMYAAAHGGRTGTSAASHSCADTYHSLQHCAEQYFPTPPGRLTAEELEARRLERQVAGTPAGAGPMADAGCAAAAA